jgi:hypothetical protein
MTEPTTTLQTLAANAYVYGYPLVYDLTEVVGQTTSAVFSTARPVNVFGHADKLALPADAFVSINNDTLYSIANCDVSREPLFLHLPDTQGRYYVMQFVDAWTNNFAYLGRRATGTKEGTYLLAGPDWQGDVPDGLTLIQTPTNVFTIVGRFAVEGEADVPAVTALQAETWLTPLGRYPDPPDNSARTLGDWDIAPYDERVRDDLAFWEKLRSWMARFPPPAAERDLIESFRPLGLLEAESLYVAPDPELAALLIEGQRAGQAMVEELASGGGIPPINGWSSAIHSFDYNTHSLGIGTIDAPEWRIDDRQRAFATRAGAARGGLWGNHGYEAAYFMTYVDRDGQQLNGANRYRIRFDTVPPVEAFWSITMYDMPKFYLVENPIERYSIGDRTPGLNYNADGSLDIFIQRDSPGPDKESNWLRSAARDFRPLLRAYQPGQSMLDRSYLLPPIQRID